MQDKPIPVVATANTGPPPEEKNSGYSNTNSDDYMEVAQRRRRRMLKASIKRRTKLNLSGCEAMAAYNARLNSHEVI